VRSLNSQEMAVINPVKNLLGISGGSNKKIKSKDLIGMKKKQKGGDTDPTDRTYSRNLANGYLVDTIDDCESAHYVRPLPSHLTAYASANTDTPEHATRLGRCVANRIAQDTGRVDTSSRLVQASFDPLAYTPATCTSAQGVRGACIPGAALSSGRSSTTSTSPVLRGYNTTGIIPEGGSRKRKSRSPPLSVKNRSSRKKAHHSTRRSRIRSSIRKSPHRKSRRSSRK
jgi:hypothetical protein